MANALMATGLQQPKIDTMGSFAQGVNARQTTENNQLTLARKGMENIGAIALGAMGGKMDGPVNPEQFEQGLDMLAEQGLNVESFRGRPEIAPIAARASLTALQQLQVAQTDAQMELAIQKFQQELSKPSGGASFSMTPVFLSDGENQHAAQMSSSGGILVNGELLPGVPEGWTVIARPENFDVKDTGDQLQVFDPNSGAFREGPTTQGAPSANLDVQMNPEGGRTMTPAAGSPQAVEAAAAEEAARAQEAARLTSDVGKADTVLSTTRDVIDILDNSDQPTTGTLSRPFAVLSNTPAGRIRSYVTTLQSGVALGAMQELKEASSTGATGFGALNEKELELLISDIGALNPDTTEPDIFRKTVKRIEDRAKRVIADIKRNVSPERIAELGLQPLLEELDALSGDDPATDAGVSGGKRTTANGIEYEIGE